MDVSWRSEPVRKSTCVGLTYLREGPNIFLMAASTNRIFPTIPRKEAPGGITPDTCKEEKVSCRAFANLWVEHARPSYLAVGWEKDFA